MQRPHELFSRYPGFASGKSSAGGQSSPPQRKSKITPWQAKIVLMRAKMAVAVTVVLLAASRYVTLVGHANPTSSGLSGSQCAAICSALRLTNEGSERFLHVMRWRRAVFGM